MPAANGCTYELVQVDRTRVITAFGEPWWWGVQRTAPDGDVQTIISDYNGNVFGLDRDRAETWACYDGTREWMGPGVEIFKRKQVDQEEE